MIDEKEVWRRFDKGEPVSRIDRSMGLPEGMARRIIVGIWRRDREEFMEKVRRASYKGRTGWKYE